jgi:pyruvate formate lyase activating enzyme
VSTSIPTGSALSTAGQQPLGEPSGVVFNLMRFAVHDGPGIRTTVFLKGCPLSCVWCHNPESQKPEPELMFLAERCIACGDCVSRCPRAAITWEGGPQTNRSTCDACGVCATVCVAGAREIAGRSMTVSEVLDQIERDTVFFDESGGGVTFSGGEPLMQPAFLEALLDACRKRGIHTAVDTCAMAALELVTRIASKADLLLCDVKAMHSAKHREYSGAPNDVILANLGLLAKSGKVLVRYPLIPGVNDSPEDLEQLSRFLLQHGLKQLNLLPYHRTGADKNTRLGRQCPFNGVPPPVERVEEVAVQLRDRGLTVKIGG